MNVEVKHNMEKSEVELKIKASGDELSPFVKEAAKKLTKDKAIKGFRPGKAPADKVAEVFGEESLMSEAMDRALSYFFVQAVQDEELEPADRPKVSIEKADRKSGVEFTAIVDVLPEVILGDLSNIEAEERAVTVEDKEIEAELTKLAKMRGNYLEVAKPAAKGDTVKADFYIEVNGKPLEGGEAKEQMVTLGEGQYIPEFEEKMQGMSAGDEREFTFKFPDDYGKKELQGKEAKAKVKAHIVQKKMVPEINDEFAKSIGEFKSLEELKKQMKENLAHEKKHREDERMQAEMMTKLSEAAKFGHISESLIEKEIDRQLEDFNQMLSMQGQALEDYMKGRGKNLGEIRAEMKDKATENVKVGLAMRQFVKQEDIQVAAEEVDEKVQEYLQRFTSTEEAEKQVDVEELKENLEGMIRNKKAMEALKKQITVKKQVTSNE